ncbi:hypothetical protein [Flavobacterium piscisymbiosum]|uniref:Uncharacterized protein n=1 Tax=Flavobacterium piscisymbiosum TaxID=2893753 RepID=A0ABS8MIS3_9FLAO|nr:hypothetical protein [Flavobacterium sp. F-30]MCC9064777.1 hypothetical protein [Flavobacterium sp. F-30]
MNSENYSYMSDESSDDITNYEEQLLLNYDDYLDAFEAKLSAGNHYNLELGDLEEDLEEDLDSEYDENDWEEIESDNNIR